MDTNHTSDRRFFTNDPGATLFDRFSRILDHAQFFDVLVGYFRTSGYKALYEKIAHVEKMRILVGLNVDQRSFDWSDPQNADRGARDVAPVSP